MSIKVQFLLMPFLFISILTGCHFLSASPIDQASEIIKTQLKSPSSYKKIYGEIIWQGTNADGMPSYIVSVLFDSANSFGALLRGCMYVSYSETIDKKVTWNNLFGVKDFSEMSQICAESTPLDIKKKMAETLVEINFKNTK